MTEILCTLDPRHLGPGAVALIYRCYSDGSCEVFRETKYTVGLQSVHWAGDPDRTITNIYRLPPGPMPELPKRGGWIEKPT